MSEMSQEARDAVGAYLADLEPSEAGRQQNWGRVVARALDPGPADDPDAVPARAPHRRGAVLLLAAAAAAVLIWWIAAELTGPALSEAQPAIGSQAADQAPSKAAAALHEATAPAVAPDAAPPEPRSDAVPDAEPSAAASERRERKPKPRVRAVARDKAPPETTPLPSAPALSADALAAETTLMSRARAALRGGAPKRALALLRQHAKQFADGAMVEERSAWTAVALCRAGAANKGRAAGRRFVRAYPRSPHGHRVRSECELGPGGRGSVTDAPGSAQ